MKTRTTNALTSLAAAAFCALCVSSAEATVDKHELEMLRTAKELEVISQKIAKAYFYKQMDIRADTAEHDLKEGLNQLKSSLARLKDGTEGKEEKNITTFLAYTHDELNNALSKPYSTEHGALMLDYSESMLEGADFLGKKHTQGKSGEEAMLVEAERLRFLLERINKYYIAHKAGFSDYNNVAQLKQAVADFEGGMAKINAYGKYPETVKANVEKINQFWPVAKDFYLGVQESALPVVVLASTDKLESEVKALTAYHQQAATAK